MSTNSVVGIATPTGFKGRYVHWDGYPAGVGSALEIIVKRDGVERAVKTLIEDHDEWSTITADSYDNRSGVLVPGYGVAYHGPKRTENDERFWYTEKDTTGGPQWAYAITATSIQVWHFDILGNDSVWERMPEHDIAI